MAVVPTGSTPTCVQFYRDDNRPTGWNNVVFENVGMPHILWELQGQQVLNHETHKLDLVAPGQMSPAEFDKAVSDLVGFMVWMGEPQQEFRRTLGIGVLAFLLLSLRCRLRAEEGILERHPLTV